MVFSKTKFFNFKSGKINTQWQELLTVSQYQNFTSAYMGTVGCVGAIYGVIVAFAFMFLMLN
jgi:hypothetical protein